MASQRNKEVPHDTEDRDWWHKHGERLEGEFAVVARRRVGLDVIRNPEKDADPTVPDLLVNGVLAEVKTQNKPFFTARRYGMDPRFTITFNRKDYRHYQKRFSDLVIYVWLDWDQTEGYGSKFGYYGGIFRLPFREIAAMIEAGAPEHFYTRRADPDDANAKSSFLLDIRRFEKLFDTEERDWTK